MKVTLNKWGNSIGIRIPKQVLKKFNLKQGDTLSIYLENGSIILNPTKVLLDCPDCETEMKHECIINGYYEYKCPKCNSLIRVNEKRH